MDPPRGTAAAGRTIGPFDREKPALLPDAGVSCRQTAATRD
jgi:hypothetical protein